MFQLSHMLKFLGIFCKLIVLLSLAVLLKERFDSISMLITELRWDTALALFTLTLHLPLFWTNLIAPLALLSALSLAADLLIFSGKGSAVDVALQVQIKGIAIRLLLAGCAALFLVPSLESMIMGNGLRLRWSLDYFLIALIGSLGLALNFFRSRQGRTLVV